MKQLNVDFAGDADTQELAQSILDKYGPPMMIGVYEGKKFAIMSLRFGTFSVDGNVTVLFPATALGDLAISYALAPQIDMVPAYPDCLNYVCMASSFQPVTNDQWIEYIGAGLQIIGLSNVLPPSQDGDTPLAIEFGPGMERTEEDKHMGVFPCGAVVCVPTTELALNRNRIMVTMMRVTGNLVRKATDGKAAGPGDKVH